MLSPHPHPRPRRAALLALVVAGSLPFWSAGPVLAAGSGKGELPALATPATGQRQPGRVVWHDLLTPDLAADERFYSGLFGWSFREMQRGRRPYAVAYADGVPVAGLLERPLPRDGARAAQWLGFISSDDVDASVRRALSLGAQARASAHDYAGRGRQAVLTDPQGITFGVLSSTGGDPPDVLAEPGEWIWSALFTRDPENETAFYQDVFGYDVYDLNDVTEEGQAAEAQAAEHIELASNGYARATVNSLPARTPQRPSRWLHFVRVDSVWSAAAKAQTLGARVVLPPRDDRQGGRIAVLADPSGALFGVMDWSDSDEGETSGGNPAAHGAGAAAPAPAGTPAAPPPPSGGTQ